jgi:hypothetical protein
MAGVAREDLQWLSPESEAAVAADHDDRTEVWVDDDPAGVESLRGAFVAAFNARDLDSLIDLVADDIEFGDASVEGTEALADELVAIWERSPGVLLTRAFGDDGPCAVAWRPDEDGCWTRAALLCFDVSDDLISLIEMPDDADALAVVTAEDPSGEELDEWLDWAEYDTGQESATDQRR